MNAPRESNRMTSRGSLVKFPLSVICVLLLLAKGCVSSVDDEYEYDYGNTEVNFDSVPFPGDEFPKTDAIRTAPAQVKVIPICCEEGEVLDLSNKCVSPPPNFLWKPKLDGASEVNFEYTGLPVCDNGIDHIDIFQKDVMFNEESEALFPYYIQLETIPPESYCVTKVLDTDTHSSEAFQTKVFACLNRQGASVLMWTCVGIAHFFILLTLLTYFVMGELRCLQGQYMICLLISLLIYNICLYPLSEISLNISDVSCIALGAVKYFFFCGVFLWFNVVCFDVWRTLSNRQDVSGRQRFLIYSSYSWIIGAVLTTVVLVLPYARNGTNQGATNDPLMEDSYNTCKLNMEMDMILQLAQLISILLDLVFLILATCNMWGYDQLGNGLLRCDASLCLKQCWKLFAIIMAHFVSTIDMDIINYPIPKWQYLLLESIAVFGVFAYRKTVIRWCFLSTCCSQCHSNREQGTLQEKNQLTIP